MLLVNTFQEILEILNMAIPYLLLPNFITSASFISGLRAGLLI